ncbi:hypothetical protein [Acinetobacter sp. Q22-2]|nr:hypothetical protein [Acinetobacter sp. Q22-2]
MSFHRSRNRLAEQRKQRLQQKHNSEKLSGLGKTSAVLSVGSLIVGGSLFLGYQQNAYAFAWITPVKEYLSQQLYTNSLSATTKQTQVVGVVVNDTMNRNANTLAATQQTIDQSMAVKDLIMDRNLKGALPDSAACTQTAERRAFDSQLKLKDMVVRDFNNVSAALPKFNTVDKKSAPLAYHLEFACSATESAQGLCNMGINGDQFMDVDYALFSSKDNMSIDKFTVAKNYLNFMNNVGLPENIATCNFEDSCANDQVRSTIRATAGSLANFVLSNQMQSRVTYNADYKPGVE